MKSHIGQSCPPVGPLLTSPPSALPLDRVAASIFPTHICCSLGPSCPHPKPTIWLIPGTSHLTRACSLCSFPWLSGTVVPCQCSPVAPCPSSEQLPFSPGVIVRQWGGGMEAESTLPGPWCEWALGMNERHLCLATPPLRKP